MRSIKYIIMIILFIVGVNLFADIISNDIDRAFSLISEKKIRGYLRYLSSDELEGRGTGQRGGELAAKYIAYQFSKFGLKKPEMINSYFQDIDLIGIETRKESNLSFGDVKFKFLDDYVMVNELEEKEYNLESELIYVGYGIEASEYKWDDYKGVDVKDKTILILVNEPRSDREDFFDGRALTYYGRWTYKYEKAAEKGALGAIIIHTNEGAGYNWDVVRNSWGREQFYIPLNKGEKRLHLASWITKDKAGEIFKACNFDSEEMIERANKPGFVPFKLCLKVKAKLYSNVRKTKTSNVLGYIEGSDGRYSMNPIIITSHYDHLGKGKSIRGDNIYNGAVDNASGVSVLLETARILSKSGIKFKRPVLFIATAAEEDGLKGSEYYVKNPLFPLDKSVNINIDSVSVWGATDGITFLGIERTNLSSVSEEIAKVMKMKIMPESHPEVGMIFRSDQFNFMKENVPSIYIKQNGEVIGKPKEWSDEKLKEYRLIKYHSPFDEYDSKWDLSGLIQMVKIIINTISAIDRLEEQPKVLLNKNIK